MIFQSFVCTLLMILGFCKTQEVTVENSELLMVNIVFRHGHRTPDKSTVYPNDPYKNETYAPYGYGELSETGKRASYHRGEIIRQNYSSFLSEKYNSADFVVRSTNTSRTNMTARYVLAGLYSQDFDTVPSSNEDINPSLNSFNKLIVNCERFRKSFLELDTRPEVRAAKEIFRDFEALVCNCTGLKTIDNSLQYVGLLNHLQAQEAMDLKLPSCFKDIYNESKNDGLKNATLHALKLLSYDNILLKMDGGTFLRDIRNSMLEFNRNVNNERRPKMYLYSAHDTSMAATIYALGIEMTKLPYFSSALAVELYRHSEKHYVRIVYYPNQSDEYEILHLRDCGDLCSFDYFLNSTEKFLPSNEDMKCEITI